MYITHKYNINMKTNTFNHGANYLRPDSRVIEMKLCSNMMLLNSNGTAPQKTPDLEEQDLSSIWG